MNYAVTVSATVQTEQYNQMKFEVTVGLTHRDLGISDDEVEELPDSEWQRYFDDLKNLANEEADRELQSFLQRAAKVSQVENLATRLTDQTPSRPARRKR